MPRRRVTKPANATSEIDQSRAIRPSHALEKGPIRSHVGEFAQIRAIRQRLDLAFDILRTLINVGVVDGDIERVRRKWKFAAWTGVQREPAKFAPGGTGSSLTNGALPHYEETPNDGI